MESYRGGSTGVNSEIKPGDTMEAALTKLWRRVLGKHGVGINDNFFDLGGTSLKAVQVIALIQKELKSAISVTTLFECPTITLLAAKLRGPGRVGSREKPGAEDAQLRGRRRRYATIRRVA